MNKTLVFLIEYHVEDLESLNMDEVISNLRQTGEAKVINVYVEGGDKDKIVSVHKGKEVI